MLFHPKPLNELEFLFRVFWFLLCWTKALITEALASLGEPAFQYPPSDQTADHSSERKSDLSSFIFKQLHLRPSEERNTERERGRGRVERWRDVEMERKGGTEREIERGGRGREIQRGEREG